MLSSLFSGSIGSFLMEILYRVPAILVALAFHEWAHAYAAYRLGDPTAFNFGRMTLNPFVHIDPIGLIMLILLRFGWAKPVPVNPRNFKNPRRDETIVSIAGVLTNFLLAFLAMGAVYLLALSGRFGNPAVNTIIYYFYFINLGLGVFNLLPIPPLDGYRFFSNLLIRHTGSRPFVFLERYGFYILLALMLSGVLTGFMSRVVGAIMSGMTGFYDGLFGLLGLM